MRGVVRWAWPRTPGRAPPPAPAPPSPGSPEPGGGGGGGDHGGDGARGGSCGTRAAPWRPPSAAPSRTRSTGSAAAGPLPGRPHVSEPRPGAARPSPAPASPVLAPSARAGAGPLPPAGAGGGGRRGGRRGSPPGRRRGCECDGGEAEVRPGCRGDAWGRVRGPSWRRRRRESGYREPSASLVISRCFGSPTPRAGEREGPLRPTLLPGAGLGCFWCRDLGTGMVLLQALEAPREVSRALPPLPGSRAQLSGEQGTAVDGPPPPALLQALPAPAGRAGDGWVIE